MVCSVSWTILLLVCTQASFYIVTRCPRRRLHSTRHVPLRLVCIRGACTRKGPTHKYIHGSRVRSVKGERHANCFWELLVQWIAGKLRVVSLGLEHSNANWQHVELALPGVQESWGYAVSAAACGRNGADGSACWKSACRVLSSLSSSLGTDSQVSLGCLHCVVSCIFCA